ncbi:MAG: peptidoglycan DD-metalloendopeptidase family protein [Holosporaceae bacterium]|jgi:septal ring factor EnvC (AmiA/AmiB activator)|nr:peptidoglycan DD-metalloendopeptidase family protein [Holosporaceae bacterium]
MNKCSLASILFFSIVSYSIAAGSKRPESVPQEMRELCQKGQELEKKIEELQSEIDCISRGEKISSPIIRNIYEIITRCFTVLLDIQRFSDLLVLNQVDNRNDFIKCSVVIKNFALYFRYISTQLKKNKAEIAKLKKKKQKKVHELVTIIAEHEKLSKEIENKALELSRTREENIIQNDVAQHLATRSESLEELDAELEAENVVGVLKNTQKATDLALTYPVVGKVVKEFGDKDANGDITCYIAIETHPKALVTSPAKGLVVFSGKFLNHGNILIISSGEYRVYLYGVDTLFSKIGDIVEIGDYVGKMNEENCPIIKIEVKKLGESLDPHRWLPETKEKKGED